jgi:hypothetical protein
VIVLTDISSLTAGVREPDDGQTLIRLLLFSNEFDIEGLIATSNMRHGQTVRPELIHQAIDAYEKVHPNLVLHDRHYPPPALLRATVSAGQPVAGPQVPPSSSIGEGKDTAGSDRIIRVVERSDPRPVWVLIWGGSADLAQALWRIRASRAPERQRRLLSKLRVHSVYDQDSTGAWIKQEWPDLFYITRNHGVRGMYRGGDLSLVSADWVRTHVSEGHGALGGLYPNYDGGDIWARTLGPVRGVKEGDTPSFLFLFPNGLNAPDRPELGGWGGRMVPEDERRLRWRDAADPDAPPGDPDPRMIAVYRWRGDFQNEMQARLDWCVRTPKECNHPPVVRLNGPAVRQVRKGHVIRLDARGSKDPDGGQLDFEWSIYPPLANSDIRVQPVGAAMAEIHVPSAGPLPDSIPVVLRVRDHGVPPLSRFARVELVVTTGK